jgi:hypothetical protein
MKRLLILGLLLGSLILPSSVLGFHHGGLPSTTCAAEAAGSPSNNNGEAKFGLSHNPAQSIPLPPVGTPAAPVQGVGAEFCANATED